GLDRILPVHADDERIMTCFLEFRRKAVTVTDVIHRRREGIWRMEKSSYQKLRLAPAWVAEQLTRAGLHVIRNETAGGMQAVAARKPPRTDLENRESLDESQPGALAKRPFPTH